MTAEVVPGLDRAQCLELLGACRYGRAVFTEQALPVVVPVPLLLAPDGVVISGGSDRRLKNLREGDVVALQADRADPQAEHADSVTVTGSVRSIRDPAEIDRLARLAAQGHWRPSTDEQVMGITLTLVRGARYRLAPGT